jgi:hypothetical protein
MGWALQDSKFGSLRALDIAHFHHVRRIVKAILCGVRGGVLSSRLEWDQVLGSFEQSKVTSDPRKTTSLILPFYNTNQRNAYFWINFFLSATCFETEGPSSGRRLYIQQLWYGTVCVTCFSISSQQVDECFQIHKMRHCSTGKANVPIKEHDKTEVAQN